jgi:hypothetical protein
MAAQASRAEAARTLREVERVRERTRRLLDRGWIGFVVFGFASLLSVPFTLIDEGGLLGAYWLIAGQLGCLITWLGFRRIELRSGVFDRYEGFYTVVIPLMVGGAILVGYTGDGVVSQAGTLFPIGAGLIAIGLFDRSALLLVSGGLITALGAGLVLGDAAHADTWAAAGSGAVLLAAGLTACAGRSERAA